MPYSSQLVNDVRSTIGHFTPNEHMGIGAMDSVHPLMFGLVPELGEVAIKPFLGDRHDQAINERNALTRAAALGLEALRPLVVTQGSLASYLVTRYRDDIHHLGMVDWHVDIASRRLHSVIKPTINRAASTAAEWHSKGVTHGDMGVKNVMYSTAGHSVFGDAERSQFHSKPDRHRLAADRDIQRLGKTMFYRGLLSDRSPTYRAGFLDDNLIGPYLEAVRGDRFDQSPDQRRAAITEYWVQVIRQNKPKPKPPKPLVA